MAADPGWLRSVVRAEVDAHRAPFGAAFDVHSHTGLDIDGSARSCDEHVADLEQIDGRSVVFPLCVTTGYRAENDRVIEECGRHSDRLVPFARIDPRTARPDVDARDALDAGARGLKLHPRAEEFGLDHPGADALLAVASEAGVPVVVHAGLGVGSFGTVLLDLARRHRGCQLILAHAGSPISAGYGARSTTIPTCSSIPPGGTRPICWRCSRWSRRAGSSGAATRPTARSTWGLR